MTSRQSALIGNGRLLVCLDIKGDVVGASWPHIDSCNQLLRFETITRAESVTTSSQRFINDAVVETLRSDGRFHDCVLPDHDVWLRRIASPAREILIYFAPQLDGRDGEQTVYFDEQSQALLAYHRAAWMAVGCDVGAVLDWQCSDGQYQATFDPSTPLTRERIASRTAIGLLRFHTHDGVGRVVTAFGTTREEALSRLDVGRAAETDLDEVSHATNHQALVAQSRNVIRLLTSSDTGGVLAGPPLHVDIPSEPGYAAVWGRDAAWAQFGSLAAGDYDRTRRYLNFAFRVQSPEGLWLHRHHTDHSLGSSWGLHQIDETGIILHLLACYCRRTGDWKYAEANLGGVRRAADFLASSIDADGLPLPSVDLWEERQSRSTYTAASVVAGLRAAAVICERTGSMDGASAEWEEAASRLLDRTVERLWSPREGRFLKARESQAALHLEDESRTDLPSRRDPADAVAVSTPIPAYPNWTTGPVTEKDLTLDVSVLGLCVPFDVMPADDPRMTATAERVKAGLWVDSVGGYRRYKGDTYGGGNPWPVATLWIACYEAARGHEDEARRLMTWVQERVGPNDMIAEQVHRTTGEPVAALPMTWAHGMVLLTTAALEGVRVWESDARIQVPLNRA